MFVLLPSYVQIFDTVLRSVTGVVHKVIHLSVFIFLFFTFQSFPRLVGVRQTEKNPRVGQREPRIMEAGCSASNFLLS